MGRLPGALFETRWDDSRRIFFGLTKTKWKQERGYRQPRGEHHS
jgi:hypothetical protein